MIKNSSKPDALCQDDFLLPRKTKKPDSVKLCLHCKSFIAGRNFWRHSRSCSTNQPMFVTPATMFMQPAHRDPNFTREILNEFRDTEAGQLCRSDATIQAVGYRMYNFKKGYVAKKSTGRKNVMKEMRELARLVLQFRCV